MSHRSRARLLTVTGLGLALTLAVLTAVAQLAPARAEPGEAYRLTQVWPGGGGQSSPGTFIDPGGLWVTPSGEVYVADSGNHRLQVFTERGRFERTWGQFGADTGQFNVPRDVAVSDQRVFVTDWGNARVQVFDLNGVHLATWTGFQQPWGVAARDGRVYITDAGAHHLQVYDVSGRRLAEWGRQGAGAGEFDQPMGVAVSSDGRLYVADFGNGRFQVLNPDGSHRRTVRVAAAGLGGSAAPIDVGADDMRNVIVAARSGLLVYRSEIDLNDVRPLVEIGGIAFDAAQGLFVSLRDSRRGFHGVRQYPGLAANGQLSDPGFEWGRHEPALGRLEGPHRLAVGHDGLAYILDRRERIQAFDMSGQAMRQVLLTGVNDIAAAADGELYIVRNRELARLSPSGEVRWVRPFTPPSGEAVWLTAITFDVTVGRAYGLDTLRREVVGLDLDSTPRISWPLSAPGDRFEAFWDLAVTGSGRTVLVNRTTKSVHVRRSDGTPLNQWPVQGTPVRLSVDDGENIYVLTTSQYVWKFTPDGTLLSVWNVAAEGPPGAVGADLAAGPNGMLLVADSEANRVLVFEADHERTPQPPPPEGEQCVVNANKRANPTSLNLGDSTEITLELSGACPSSANKADVMLVIDRSGSMNDQGKLEAAKQAALAFIATMDLSRDRVGLVAFESSAQLVESLTSDASSLLSAILGMTAQGGTNIGEAVSMAQAELRGANGRPDAQPSMVLLTDGRPTDPGGQDAALAAASAAKDAGTRLFTIGYGQDADPDLLAAMASTSSHFFYAPSERELERIYSEVALRIFTEILLRQVSVTDQLPANMRYVPGSGHPLPALQGQTLTWQFNDVTMSGMRMRYRVQPLDPGTHRTNIQAEANYLDGLEQPGRVAFPIPAVQVNAESPTTTATGAPATRTPTPTPTHTPTATPSATASPRPAGIHLPLVRKSRLCQPSRAGVDVALVMDSSVSMLGDTTAGRTKLQAAQEAARLFIAALGSSDQATLVTFTDSARVLQRLTSERARLISALDRIAVGAGSRMDLGIQTAHAELRGPLHRAGNNAAMVIMTDGQISHVPVEVAVQRADEARRDGVVIYAVGVGSDFDRAALELVAGDPQRFYFAPDGEDLRRIYAEIAAVMPCPE
jgi:Mg-chelatase subunit ChlD